MVYTKNASGDGNAEIHDALQYLIEYGMPMSVNADIDIGDVNLLDIEGEAVNPAKIFTRKAGPHKLTVGEASLTLAEMLAVTYGEPTTLNAATTKIRFIVPDEGIYWGFGVDSAVAATSPPLMPDAWESECTRAELLTMEFITASGTVVMWIEELG